MPAVKLLLLEIEINYLRVGPFPYKFRVRFACPLLVRKSAILVYLM
jgi:hypothetical protein